MKSKRMLILAIVLTLSLTCINQIFAASYSGNLNEDNKNDYYAFTITEDQVLTLSGVFGVQSQYVYWGVADEDQDTMKYSLAISSDDIVIPLAPGTYHVYASEGNIVPTSYTLTTSFAGVQPKYNEVEINDDYDRVQVVGTNNIYGTLGHYRRQVNKTDGQDKMDYFQYTIPDYPGTLAIDGRADATLAYQTTKVRLFDPQQVFFNEFTFFSTDESHAFYMNQGGDFYIVALIGLFDFYGGYDLVMNYTAANVNYNENEPNCFASDGIGQIPLIG